MDDTVQNLQVLGTVLREAGYKVSAAQSGAQALEVVQKTPPALILLDVMMPAIDGFEVCRRLKRDPVTAEIPVIFLTAKTEAADIVQGFELGAVDYVNKPFNPPELLGRVRTHLELALLRRDLERQVEERTAQLRREHEERLRAERQLADTRRLEGMGRLALGVAHEINTPLQAVAGNLQFLEEALGEFQGGLEEYAQLLSLARTGQWDASRVQDIGRAIEARGLDYLTREFPQALRKSRAGVERVARVVRAMQLLARTEGQEKVPCDLNGLAGEAAEALRPRWEPVAELRLELDPDLPAVPCLPGDFATALHQLLANAADAVAAAGKGRGRIGLSTRRQGACAVLRVADSGTGIPPEVRERIFDPFFTTKDVGAGMGVGLALVREVVVNRLGGEIRVETEVGRGTVFALYLPLQAA